MNVVKWLIFCYKEGMEEEEEEVELRRGMLCDEYGVLNSNFIGFFLYFCVYLVVIVWVI